MKLPRPGLCLPLPGAHRRRLVFLPGNLVIAVLVMPMPRALAHPVLSDYVRHDISLTVGPAEIHLDVELTFEQFCAMSQRRRMDADHDGRLTRHDQDAYLADIEESIEDGVQLDIAGHPVDLILLYDPRIELQQDPRVDLTPCIVRLSFFAHTPPSLAASAEIIIEDHLWPSLPAVCKLDAGGQEGIWVFARSGEEIFASPERGSQARRLRARCVAASFPSRQSGQARRNVAPTQAYAAQLPLPLHETTPLGAPALLSEKMGVFILCAALTAAGTALLCRRFKGETL